MTQTEAKVPAWLVYPEDEWVQITPAQAGFDEEKFGELAAGAQMKGAIFEGEVHGENEWGTVLTRGGYLVHAWGDPHYSFQTASVAKAFSRALVGLAAREGLLDPDEVISKTWTGEGELSHPHKYLDRGHHKTLTWRHLVGGKEDKFHAGGFPVTNGFFWRQGAYAHSATGWGRGYYTPRDSKTKRDRGSAIPDWAEWTGDPFYDNYAHAAPGTVEVYSSGGIWRLAQALTFLWGRDLKQVLDEQLFGEIGIRADRWDWIPGRSVYENKDFYASMPGYGDFVDPPYEIGGHPVRGGGGWAVMSASDLARFGLLVATDGVWKGKQLIDAEWVRSHGGGNGSFVIGDPDTYISAGIVTTQGLPPIESFRELVTGPVAL